MLLNKERCAKCRSERSVRNCPRLRGKLIGWKCCNGLRIDLRCPESCPYAASFDASKVSPFPAFRADSNTEFGQAARRFIDLWCYQPQPELEGNTPAEKAAGDSTALLAWLSKFQYPANFPVAYLMEKLGFEHERPEEPETPETVALGFFDAIIAHNWEQTRAFSQNELDDPELIKRYQHLLSTIPELARTKSCDILHAGAADDGVSAIVVLELNRKLVWTVLLSSSTGSWRIKQNLNGSPQLYYAQNQLFREIAEALGNGNDQLAWDLIKQSLPKYPDCADLYYYRALYWQLAKNKDRMREDFLNSWALDNNFFEAGFALATLYLSEKELLPAQAALRQLQVLRPEDLNVRNNLAACAAGLGNTEAAIGLWREILNTDPNYEPARKNLERYPKN
ncbi:MAG: hypothetical protein K0B87_04775 [Candidatus Syntrophosphaera sp.]|nr:hypothetical protein [Candidatus Syntrophosphaera sp.]